MAFRAGGTPLGRALLEACHGPPLHLAGHLKINTWQGRETAELHIRDAAPALSGSAAAAPEFLYVEGEGSFEFERTASRLREMQSEEWG